MYVKDAAFELWRRHDLQLPVDLRRLATELGLEVVSFPFVGRVQEAIVDKTIGVRPGVSRPWFRWYVAHAIGHHVLHVGTSFYLAGWQWPNRTKAERQAEEFAAFLVAGSEGWQSSAPELGIPRAKIALVRRVTSPRPQ